MATVTAVREKYPLGLCVAAIVMTAAGLSAAALDVQWGAAPASGGGLRQAWIYVQVMAALTWLLQAAQTEEASLAPYMDGPWGPP